MLLQTRGSRFMRYQEVRIQELPDQVPIGHIPRAMTVQCRAALTRQCSPGEKSLLVNIVGSSSLSWFRNGFSSLSSSNFLNTNLHASVASYCQRCAPLCVDRRQSTGWSMTARGRVAVALLFVKIKRVHEVYMYIALEHDALFLSSPLSLSLSPPRHLSYSLFFFFHAFFRVPLSCRRHRFDIGGVSTCTVSGFSRDEGGSDCGYVPAGPAHLPPQKGLRRVSSDFTHLVHYCVCHRP